MRLPGGRRTAVALLVLGALAAGLAVDELLGQRFPDRAAVTVLDENGTRLGSVDAAVAASWRARYVGLSDTDALGPDEGMLFVHGGEGPHTYVMRGMAFPIDIVFVGADRRIDSIYHAEVEEPPLTRYRGRGKWVLEVQYRWTTRHGVSTGDVVRVDWGAS